MKLQDTLLNIRIATPCHARWDQMEGDARARFCGQCRKHVYNLSAMTTTAAAELVREKEGKLCVRFYQRADGTMLHGDDCPVGLAARQWRRIKNFAGAAASLALLLLGVNRANAGSQTGSPSVIEKQGKVIMGAVPAPTPNPTPTPAPKPTATPPSDKK